MAELRVATTSVFRKANGVFFRRLKDWFCVGLVLSSLTATAASARKERGAEFFNEPTLRTFHFEVSEAALNQLRQNPKTYVSGTVREGEHVMTNVAIRLRGHGSFRSLAERPSFAIKFDEFVTNQSYRGLSKLMFNNSVQDETCFAEFISTDLFRRAGVPAARVTHARALLNGRDLGAYVVIEAMNKDFLKRHFGSGKGNLYEAHLTDSDVALQQDNGVRGDQADLRKLYQVCSITNANERWRELQKVLDVDRFVSFAAMEMLTAHWDGYVMHTNNYRIYHDPKSDRFVFIPHGMDWTFLRPTLSIQSPLKTIVGRAVLDTPEGKALYQARVGSLFTNAFQVPALNSRIEAQLVKIRSGDLSANELARLERGAALMRERILIRTTSAANELGGVRPVPLTFDTNNLARLTNWRADLDGGTGAVDRVTLADRPALHISAGGVHTHASWRSLVYLARGSYRYEGRLRIDATNAFVAMLRISGPSTATVWQSPTDWRELTYDFRITDEGADVEFVCDFSGERGDAWFDLDSLRVRRIGP